MRIVLFIVFEIVKDKVEDFLLNYFPIQNPEVGVMRTTSFHKLPLRRMVKALWKLKKNKKFFHIQPLIF